MIYIVLKNSKEYIAFDSLKQAEEFAVGRFNIFTLKNYEYLYEFETILGTNFAIQFSGPLITKNNITKEFIEHSIKSAESLSNGISLKALTSIINKKGEVLYVRKKDTKENN